MNKPELKPCRHCGSTPKLHRKKYKYWYECDGDCWTSTNKYYSEEDAAQEWNSLQLKTNYVNDLKPCPFCGHREISSRDVDPFDGYQGNMTVRRIWCRNCGAQIEHKNAIDAFELWNRRADR